MSLTVPQIKRACELADAGLSDAGVAIVLGVDFGVSVDRGVVRYYRRRYGVARRESFGSMPGVAKSNGVLVGGRL